MIENVAKAHIMRLGTFEIFIRFCRKRKGEYSVLKPNKNAAFLSSFIENSFARSSS